MKKVLFVSYGGGHIKILSLIADALEKSEGVDFKILALTTAYKTAIIHFPDKTTGLLDYTLLFNTHRLEIANYGKSLLSENFNPDSGISEKETLQYLGLSMFDLVHKYGKKRANELYNRKKRQAFLPVEVMKKILQYEDTDIVVSTTAPRFEQASLIAGNQLGIETIEILDLFGELYPLPEAKHIVCMNKSVSDSLKQQGLIDREYYHYGQPAIEKSCKAIASIDSHVLKQHLGINKNTVLLYATQQPNVYNEDFSYAGFAGYETINNSVFSIFERLHENFSIDILLRIHPNESINDYQFWLDKYPFVKYINNELNVPESISVCDALLTQASTISVEAMVAGKQVFTFRYHLDQTYPLPGVTMKPFIHANGFEDLESKLLHFLQNDLPNYRRKNVDFLPLNSVENIVKLIEKI